MPSVNSVNGVGSTSTTDTTTSTSTASTTDTTTTSTATSTDTVTVSQDAVNAYSSNNGQGGENGMPGLIDQMEELNSKLTQQTSSITTLKFELRDTNDMLEKSQAANAEMDAFLQQAIEENTAMLQTLTDLMKGLVPSSASSLYEDSKSLSRGQQLRAASNTAKNLTSQLQLNSFSSGGSIFSGDSSSSSISAGTTSLDSTLSQMLNSL